MVTGQTRFWALFMELMEEMPRGGPGDPAATLRALRFIPKLPAHPRILDLGCGPGEQTLTLARHTDGVITAVDKHPPFIARLEQSAAAAGLSGRILPRTGDMTVLDVMSPIKQGQKKLVIGPAVPAFG